MNNERTCPVCGDRILGRIDKKFCSDQCRAEYNNCLNKESTSVIRKINSILRKNRRILIELNPEGKTKISRRKLIDRGFNFQYFTSIYRTKTGNTYYFCYEQGYLPLESDYCALVARK